MVWRTELVIPDSWEYHANLANDFICPTSIVPKDLDTVTDVEVPTSQT
jgi:hypothetical protein